MECKLAMIVVVIITDRELIDTLWNVNQKTMELKRYENMN